jgi:hypothetical protein
MTQLPKYAQLDELFDAPRITLQAQYSARRDLWRCVSDESPTKCFLGAFW